MMRTDIHVLTPNGFDFSPLVAKTRNQPVRLFQVPEPPPEHKGIARTLGFSLGVSPTVSFMSAEDELNKKVWPVVEDAIVAGHDCVVVAATAKFNGVEPCRLPVREPGIAGPAAVCLGMFVISRELAEQTFNALVLGRTDEAWKLHLLTKRAKRPVYLDIPGYVTDPTGHLARATAAVISLGGRGRELRIHDSSGPIGRTYIGDTAQQRRWYLETPAHKR